MSLLPSPRAPLPSPPEGEGGDPRLDRGEPGEGYWPNTTDPSPGPRRLCLLGPPSPSRGEGAPRLVLDCWLNSTRLGKNPASVLPAPVGAISSTERPARAFANSSSWCARGIQPRLANQRAKGSGRPDRSVSV